MWFFETIFASQFRSLNSYLICMNSFTGEGIQTETGIPLLWWMVYDYKISLISLNLWIMTFDLDLDLDLGLTNIVWFNVVGDFEQNNLITTYLEITSHLTSKVRNTFKTSKKSKILVRILMIFQSEKSQKLGPKGQILKVAAVRIDSALIWL